MESMSNYILSPKTLALLPHYNEYGEIETIVVEDKETFKVPKKQLDVLKQGARYYGTTLETTKIVMKDVFGNTNMAPIIMYAPQPLVFFPAKRLKDDLCSWFSALGVMNAFPLANRFCEVLLMNGDVVELDISLEAFRKRLKVADAFIGYAFVRYQQIQQNLKLSLIHI